VASKHANSGTESESFNSTPWILSASIPLTATANHQALLPGFCLKVTLDPVEGAFVAGALVTGADVTGALVTGALVTGAEVTGADVTGALVTGALVTGAEVGLVVGAEVDGEDDPKVFPVSTTPPLLNELK